jgi:hypothetical protein
MASPARRPKSPLRKLLGGFVVSVARAFAPTSALADGAPGPRDGLPRYTSGTVPARRSHALGIRGVDPRAL